MKYFLYSILMVLFACSTAQEKTFFPEKALKDTLLTFDGLEKTVEEVLSQYKGKIVVLDIWASWCGDCIAGLPKVKELQETYGKDIAYVFFSMDKTPISWKKGIARYGIEGAHYFIPSGRKSDFCTAISVDWIPRYMILDKEGKILVYNAIKATDIRLEALLKKVSNKNSLEQKQLN